MLTLNTITDPVYVKPAKPSYFERFIRDPRMCRLFT